MLANQQRYTPAPLSFAEKWKQLEVTVNLLFTDFNKSSTIALSKQAWMSTYT